MIMLHEFDSNSKHTFLPCSLQIISSRFLKIVSCDMRLVLTEHTTYIQ